MAARKIAGNINPKEITGEGTAYQFSAPTVNTRGEVVQGNNRADALKEIYTFLRVPCLAHQERQDSDTHHCADIRELSESSPFSRFLSKTRKFV